MSVLPIAPHERHVNEVRLDESLFDIDFAQKETTTH
jgi:hypothetical protein